MFKKIQHGAKLTAQDRFPLVLQHHLPVQWPWDGSTNAHSSWVKSVTTTWKVIRSWTIASMAPSRVPHHGQQGAQADRWKNMQECSVLLSSSSWSRSSVLSARLLFIFWLWRSSVILCSDSSPSQTGRSWNLTSFNVHRWAQIGTLQRSKKYLVNEWWFGQRQLRFTWTWVLGTHW